MKNAMKKILVCVLALTLTLSCALPAALAATKENVRQYGKEGGYLAIGDSISRGCGAEGFYLDTDKAEGGQYDLYYMRNVKGAVPTQVAEAVGCTMPDDMAEQDATFWPFCYPGMTVAVTMDLLGIEDNFKDEKLNYAYYKDMLQYFGYEGSFDGVREGDTYVEGECGQCGNIIELIKKADLITLQLGMCDIFYRAYRIISNGGMLADGLSFDLSSPEAIKNLLETAISEMHFGYDYWEAHYPVLLQRIKELNPDATIVMVGSFNLVNQLRLTDDTVLPIGSIISGITDKMNRKYEQWEKEYGVKYADISNTETQATENDWALLGDFKDNTFTGTHPSQTGYNYIVRQILAELPAADGETETAGLSVDLGRFDAVDYVLLNGIPVKNYSMDGFVLNIPNASILATNLTVGVKGEDGKIAVQTYAIRYTIGQGFTASRLYGNNDAAGFATKPFRTFINLIKSLFDKIVNWVKGLFNRG